MFTVIVQIQSPAEGAEALQQQHSIYSELAGRHGVLFKHVMHSEDDPTRFIDIMLWNSQADSEKFGVDPEYQAQRPKPRTYTLPGSMNWISPGYFDLISTYTNKGTSTRQTTGFFTVTPGKELEFERAAKALDLAAANRLTDYRVYRNFGFPNRYVVAVQWPGDDAPPMIGKLAALDLYTEPPKIDTGELIVRYDFA